METNEKQKHLKFFGIPKILPFLKNVRGQILMMVVLAIISSFVDITIPQFQRYALDTFVGKCTMATIVPFVLCYIAVILLASVVNYISCAQATIVEMKVNRELRQVGFKHLQTLSFSYFNQNSVGYIHARLMSDTGRIGGLVSWWLIDCTWRISYLVGAIFVMIRMNAKLAMMVLATVPLLVLLFSIFQKKLIEVNREVREVNSKITGNFNEGIMGAKTIKSLSIEDKMEKRFTDETENMRNRAIRASRLRGLFAGTMNFASSAALAIVLWKGGYIALEEIGTFSVFMSYAQGMMEPLRWLVDIVSDLITTQVNIERFTNLLAVQSDVIDTPEVIEKYGDCFEPKKENWEPIKGDIEFKDVDFNYNENKQVLKKVSFTAKQGEITALVGPSGSGKTTAAKLAARFWDIQGGKVTLGGQDISKIDPETLLKNFSIVFQDVVLFNTSIKDNIRIGKRDASDEEILKVAKLAGCDEFVLKMPQGYDTVIGENGETLSGGERQRISIARALLKDAPIILLDEATASLDVENESKIQRGISQLVKGKTVIIIAHRMRTIANADKVVVLQDGHIAETGSPAELKAKGGLFCKMLELQMNKN